MSEIISAAQVRAARALLGWSQADLARNAKVGTSTVADFERGQRTPIPNTIAAIRAALEAAGVNFQEGGAVVGPVHKLAREAKKGGSPPRWIDGTDLSQWGERRDAQDSMAELISRLIRAATGLDARLRFPAKEGVQRPGWDGTCEVGAGTDYVPSGASRWEIGTNRTCITTKANEDYAKRTSDPLGVDPLQSTFVFVTPHRWNEKEKWLADRRAEGKWARIEAYDAEDLVHWIELYPSVGEWIAVKMGKRPATIRQLDEVWEEWSLATRVPASPELVLAGRDAEAAAVLRWLREPPSIFSLQAESGEEAIAFLHAAIWQLPEPYAAAYRARCLVADSPDAARQLGDSPTPLTIVLEEADAGLAGRLVQRGHHVFIAYGWEAGVRHEATQLARASRFVLEPVLGESMGLPEDDASRLAADSLGSLAVIRRLMPRAPGRLPRWASGTPSRALLAAMLAGAWDEGEEGDRAMIARLAGMDYAAVTNELAPWIGVGDSPLRRSGSVWRISSSRDAWFLLARFLSDADIELYASVALNVLGSSDPRFELPAEERWYAAVKGVRPPFSGYLRHGVGETLILLSLFGQRASGVTNAGARVDRIVRTLLDGADSERWWSLSRDFQLLAEASPDSFMEALEGSLDQSPPAVQALFGEDDSPVFGTQHLSGLLWALQTLALNPAFLPRAAVILARLATIDPGGHYTNRPANSLRDIFLLLRPQTQAPAEERLAVLDLIRSAEPAAAWPLMLQLLPSDGILVGSAPSPRWRDVGGEPEPVTYQLVGRQIEGITSRILSDAGADPERWVQLLGVLSNLPSASRLDAIDLLVRRRPAMDREGKLKVWAQIRYLLNHHRAFAGAEWAMQPTEIGRLDDAYQAFTPEDEIDRIAWLFSHRHGLLPRPIGHDFRKNEELTAQLRREATGSLFEASGVEAIFALATAADEPGLVGVAVAELPIPLETKDIILVRGLRGPEKRDQGLAHGIAVKWFEQAGRSWALSLLDRAEAGGWGAEAIARFLRALPSERWVWNRATSAGDDVRALYWKRVVPLWIKSETPEDVATALEELSKVGRARDALSLAAFQLKVGIPSELLLSLLRHALEQPWDEFQDSNERVMFQHNVEEILLHLDEAADVSTDSLAAIEWSYVPLLQHSRRKPKALQEMLARNPSFFVDVMSALYRPDPESGIAEPEAADAAQAKAIAAHAHDLLQAWTLVPGMEKGEIDPDGLRSWLREARSLSTKAGRGRIADIVIGGMLGRAPVDADGCWPPIAIRDAIESVRSKELERGIANGRFNNRGVTSRAPTDGGQLERAEAAFYRRCSQAVASKWLRTSALLERMAKHYDSLAESHDQDAERLEWR